MDRYVVMVDAGYLLRQSIEIVSSRASTKRAELDITSPAGLIEALLEKSKATLNLQNKELLRVYWYDGIMSNGLTSQQRSIMELPDVQFRAGTVNSNNQQKGVDSLIVTDLIELTTHHAICDAVLVTGDSDLAVGIELAQKKGIRVAVLGIEDLSQGVSHKQSFEITSRADRVGRLGGAELTPVMHYEPPVPPAPTAPKAAVVHTPAKAQQKAHPKTSKGQAPAIDSSESSVAQSAPAITLDVSHTDNATTQFAPSHAEVTGALRSLREPVAEKDKPRIDEIVRAFIKSQASMDNVVDPSTKRIVHEMDKALLHSVYVELGNGKLSNAEKIFARQIFLTVLGFS